MRVNAKCSFLFLEFHIGKKQILIYKRKKEISPFMQGIPFYSISECTLWENLKNIRKLLFLKQFQTKHQNNIKGFLLLSKTQIFMIKFFSQLSTALSGTEIHNWLKNSKTALIKKEKTTHKSLLKILEFKFLFDRWYF